MVMVEIQMNGGSVVVAVLRAHGEVGMVMAEVEERLSQL